MQYLGNFIVFIAVKIQQKGCTEDLRQSLDRRVDLFDPHITFSPVAYSSLILVDQELIGGIIENGFFV